VYLLKNFYLVLKKIKKGGGDFLSVNIFSKKEEYEKAYKKTGKKFPVFLKVTNLFFKTA
jgi:hypothetical protein